MLLGAFLHGAGENYVTVENRAKSSGLGFRSVARGASVLAQQDRIVTSIDASRRIVLQGDRSFRARLENDGGRLASGERISGITILLKGSDSQRAALQSLLEQQRDPTSPNYHRWLTPEEYADRFGLSRNDFQKAIDWLRSQGFSVDYKTRARNWIGFSGTVAQIQTAFQVEIHLYVADGETHYANSQDPRSPLRSRQWYWLSGGWMISV